MFSPLEQFELSILRPLHFSSFDFSITNATVYTFFVFIFASLFLYFGIFRLSVLPSYWAQITEFFYLFVLDVMKQQAGKASEPYFPIFFTTFIFILFSNLLGLVPFSFSVTGQIAVTLTLALSFNIGFIVLGFQKNGFSFLQLFVPSGVPAPAIPLIVVIEVVSYLLRTFSLSVRLFANIMAGHTLLHILASFSIAFINSGFHFLAVFPFILVVAITFLELGIAFLQAYVFVVLLSIYLNDSFHPVHLLWERLPLNPMLFQLGPGS